MYGLENLDLLELLGHFSLGGTRWLPARPFFAIPLYPWFQLVFAWRNRHYVVAEDGVVRGSIISVILEEVPLTSRKLHSSRRKIHPPQRRIPYSGGCSRHATDITFYQAAGPSATALYPSFLLLFLRPTGNHVLADDTCAFQNQVCCTLGNAYDTLGRVYNSELHLEGRNWLRNCNYTNPHFRTDRNETLHTSPLGLEETIGRVWAHNISLFLHFDLFCLERVPIPAQLIAAGSTLPRYCVMSVMRCVLVWRHGRDVHCA
jgi:hypothetical protein